MQQRQPVGSLSQCNAIIVKITPKTDLGQGWVQFEFDWDRAVGRSEKLRGQVCNTGCRFFMGGVQNLVERFLSKNQHAQKPSDYFFLLKITI